MQEEQGGWMSQLPGLKQASVHCAVASLPPTLTMESQKTFFKGPTSTIARRLKVKSISKLLAPQSNAHSRGAFRDFHPIPVPLKAFEMSGGGYQLSENMSDIMIGWQWSFDDF